jgi:carboxymethylenebutenolidase
VSYPYEGQIAETVTHAGDRGDQIEAYAARPLGPGPFPGVVVVHHMPGWDPWTKEVVRNFAHRGYQAIAPHLYCRLGPGSPDDLAAKARAAGGVPDAQVVADLVGAAGWLRHLPTANGKVGVIGFCSGGRHSYLAAGLAPDVFDAAVDCWGGNVVVDDPAAITAARPVAPVDYTPALKAPILGIFGNEDRNPTVDQVDRLEAELKKHGKTYEFRRYDGAGHGFFAVNRQAYRVDQANDGWEKVFAFFGKYLR